MIDNNRILISFVGTNDRGNKEKNEDGAILNTFRERKFDKVYLLWCNNKHQKIDFKKIAVDVQRKLRQNNLCKDVYLFRFFCKNITDHNEIYPKLVKFCKEIDPKKENDFTYTAAISSGTPAMQACWILMSESRDFPIKLIRSNEVRFGKPIVQDVKLNTSLPSVISKLEQKVHKLEKDKFISFPTLAVNSTKGIILIGKKSIQLTSLEFCYYRYFVNLAKKNLQSPMLVGIEVPHSMLSEIENSHKLYFQNDVRAREFIHKILINEKKETSPYELSIQTLRAHLSRINKKIKTSLSEMSQLIDYYTITKRRNSREYSIKLHPSKILLD
jgi:hypothetical protein